jgi:Right handed beta helix region
MKKVPNFYYGLLIFACLSPLLQRPLAAQEVLPMQVIVNSDRDGTITPDTFLTLREAIELVNGTLSLTQLSAAEQKQVKALASNVSSRIEFNLPPKQTTIRLVDILPPLASPGLIINGQTQPGYATKSGRLNNTLVKELPLPIVAITPAENVEIFRGLTIVADNITVRGLSFYGFTAKHGATASTPPADIFIADELTAKATSQQQNLQPVTLAPSKVPPQGVVIENNWLGSFLPRVDSSTNKVTVIGIVYDLPRSAFGVSVFNSLGTTIRNNLITNHDGSGIITGKQATNLRITSNVIERNGLAGMPDAIRLEGNIQNTEIVSNLIENNAGSAVFLFKPEGAVQIRDNAIANNGKRFIRAAIYLMGNEHQVTGNQIINQNGSGVVVAAYPQSRNNKITNNQFSNLSGLAIDLVTQLNVSPQDYQKGDGANPLTDSYQRRRKTGNFGMDAPRFLSSEFFIISSVTGVTLDGLAEPNSEIEIYRSQNSGTRELIGKPIATTKVNEKGRFSINLGILKPGERVSAIATHPKYGTSEPAVNAVVRSIENQNNRQ